METLSMRDRELVALGAALRSNCVSCIKYHVPQARKAGLSDQEIGEAIMLADKGRQVPAAKVMKAALTMIGKADESSPGANTDRLPQNQPPAGEPCCT